MPLITKRPPAIKFTNQGDMVTGVITGSVIERQQTDYVTGEPKFFPDGNPMPQWLIPLYVQSEHSPIDDGTRTLYVQGKNLTSAIRDAVRRSGASDLEVGGTLTVRFDGEHMAAQPHLRPAKFYLAEYRPPPAGGSNTDQPPF